MGPFWEAENNLLEFLKTFEVKKYNFEIFQKGKQINESKYKIQIQEIINKEKYILVIDLQDFDNDRYSNLKNLVYFNTLRFLKILENSIDRLINEYKSNVTAKHSEIIYSRSEIKKMPHKKWEEFSFLKNKKPGYQIILKPPAWMRVSTIDLIGADFIGKLIMVKGFVVKIDTVYNFIKEGIYRCSSCGLKISKKKIREKFRPFFFCPTKKCQLGKIKGRLFINIKESIFEKFQEIKIQETFNQKKNMEVFWSLNIRLFGQATRTCLPGEKIKAAGILLPEISISSLKKIQCEKIYLEALFLEKNDIRTKNREKKKKKEIVTIFKDPEVYSRVAFSLAPSIFGFWDIKKAAVLSLLSFNSCGKTGFSNIREGINILFGGSSGTGKSSLLKMISDLGNPGFFINSPFFFEKTQPFFENKNFNFDPKLKKSEQFFPKKGIICIDEIIQPGKNKVSFLVDLFSEPNNLWDQSDLKVVSTSSFSIVATASTQDLFLFYLKGGHQLKQFFSHFDLCFFSNNYPNFEFDYNLANHMTNLYNSGKIETKFKIIKKEILKIFFLEARKVSPFFPKSLFDLIIYNYIVLRAQNSEHSEKGVTVLILFSIFRLSTALARLRFHVKVSPFDIHEASRLIGSSNESFDVLKQKKSIKEQSKLRRKIYDLIRNLSIRKKKLTVDLLNLENFVLTKGFSRQNLVDCLGYYEDRNIWTISVSQAKLVFLI